MRDDAAIPRVHDDVLRSSTPFGIGLVMNPLQHDVDPPDLSACVASGSKRQPALLDISARRQLRSQVRIGRGVALDERHAIGIDARWERPAWPRGALVAKLEHPDREPYRRPNHEDGRDSQKEEQRRASIEPAEVGWHGATRQQHACHRRASRPRDSGSGSWG